jgi:phosphate starvation-inducible PhoH-like protein
VVRTEDEMGLRIAESPESVISRTRKENDSGVGFISLNPSGLPFRQALYSSLAPNIFRNACAFFCGVNNFGNDRLLRQAGSVNQSKRNSLNIDTREISLEPADNARLLSLCGPFDDNIKQLERRLGIEINRRDNHFKLTGRPICVNAAADILRSLYVDTAPMRGEIQDIEPEQIHLAIKEARVLEQSAESVPDYGKAINIKTKRGVIKPRTPNQAQYIANILDHDITFGVGPAGTGKTYLAVAAAVDALERQEIRRILLTRPAVEAGEKLGFLPGDLSQKVDPYLRPLYDALFEMLGFEKVEKLIERNVIEVARWPICAAVR